MLVVGDFLMFIVIICGRIVPGWVHRTCPFGTAGNEVDELRDSEQSYQKKSAAAPSTF